MLHLTDDGPAFRTLNVLYEFDRECLAIRMKRKLNSVDMIDVPTYLFILQGRPVYIGSDDDQECIAEVVHNRIAAVGIGTNYIKPGSPWENVYVESFNARIRDKLLNGELFYTLHEAQFVIEKWWHHYNTKSTDSSLGYRPPAPEAIIPVQQRLPMN